MPTPIYENLYNEDGEVVVTRGQYNGVAMTRTMVLAPGSAVDYDNDYEEERMYW